MNRYALLGAKLALGSSLALGLTLSPHSTAHVYADTPHVEHTWTCEADGHTVDCVKLSEVPWIDSLPSCSQEDCSDRAEQVGVWTNDGNAWLELGESETYLVVDDTTHT